METLEREVGKRADVCNSRHEQKQDSKIMAGLKIRNRLNLRIAYVKDFQLLESLKSVEIF